MILGANKLIVLRENAVPSTAIMEALQLKNLFKAKATA